MPCCGDDDDEEQNNLLTPLISSDPISNITATTSMVISPMNSNFTALLSVDLLRLILQQLPSPSDLARAACVCRLWRSVASDREILELAFRSPWNVSRILGEPSSSAFWRHPALSRFAISHRVSRGDTVVGLALKYSVQVMEIKRLNNMMSDHGIYSRERILIPISKPELLVGSTCYIEVDEHAKREVAVLYLEGSPIKKGSCSTARDISERGKKKILESIKRSMQVDEGTAEYYLTASNGDPRAAILQFSEDLRWEQQNSYAC